MRKMFKGGKVKESAFAVPGLPIGKVLIGVRNTKR
jgi:hypothetical protein